MEPTQPKHKRISLAPRGILWIDDDLDTYYFVSLLKEASPHKVTLAESLAEAIQYILQHRFALIVIHKWLADDYAFETLRRLRTRDSETPAVVYAQRIYDADREKALNSGAQYYIQTPAALDEWVETIKGLLNADTITPSALAPSSLSL